MLAWITVLVVEEKPVIASTPRPCRGLGCVALPALPAGRLKREVILRRLAERIVAAFGLTIARFFASPVDECAADVEEPADGAGEECGSDAKC
jgi:hypothetical protein